MSQKIDSAVFNTIADMLERLQTSISAEYKKAEKGSPAEKVFSNLEDILGNEIENLRDMADEDDEE